ncbi:dnaJ homolog subfamily C member 11 [Caerostris extrusa]|uniref:DnaJ homolog subfamily C member 11 n=1 Tax=Caerostris extrusa TaxID=172846 RepID=A0AAV4UPK0_CAEEX|nr:dnaJ homolog subfamily C member 11 [Caerostris extrusa]
MIIGIPTGVTLKLKINRANQTFLFPIMLSEELLPSAIFYGTAAPILGYFVLKKLYIDPYHEKQKEAVYGSTENISNLNPDQFDSQLDILDVTVQLQCLVKDSSLILPNRSKSNLQGFYDPCLGEDKQLRIDYHFRNIAHSITIADNEMLRIPRITDH